MLNLFIPSAYKIHQFHIKIQMFSTNFRLEFHQTAGILLGFLLMEEVGKNLSRGYGKFKSF